MPRPDPDAHIRERMARVEEARRMATEAEAETERLRRTEQQPAQSDPQD